MESTPPAQATTLASILETEKVIPPARARSLLAALAQVNALPTGPSTPREWAAHVLVSAGPSGAERAVFRENPSVPKPLPDWAAHVARLIDALRATAIAMLWGLDGASASADRRAASGGQSRFPRLHDLLIEQWDATRSTCDSVDKFMMFFEATLALDRAAEPKVGREAFKTLSIQALDARKKDVKVGTLGVPFAAIIDTGKFKKAERPASYPAPEAGSPPAPALETSSAATRTTPPPTIVPPPASSSPKAVIIGALAAIALLALALVFFRR